MPNKPLPAKVTDEEIKEAYEKTSKFYGIVEERFERKVRKRGLELLDPKEGEKILEVGFGTGCSLVEIAKAVGESGKAYGIDIAKGMVKSAERRIKKEEVSDRVELSEGDARNLPYRDSKFDAVYMNETLEIFDLSDIFTVLDEAKRVLKEDGRLGVASMTRRGYEDSNFVRIYEWLHNRFPKYLNCRPIYLQDLVQEAGYEVKEMDEVMVAGLCPMRILVSKPEKIG